MITLKKRPSSLTIRPWKLNNPQRFVPMMAIAVIALLVIPSLSHFALDQFRTQAAGGKSCIRLAADRKSQVRKYGSECD
jgi:hypothetical protein